MKHAPKASPKNTGAQRVKDQAARLLGYLGTQSVHLSRTQGLEAISHAVHGKPWNVVRALETAGPDSAAVKVAGRHDPESGNTLVLPPGAKALDFDALMRITQAGAYSLDVAVPLGLWDLIDNDIEWVNDTVSELVTGSIAGLQNIAFTRHPVPDGLALPEEQVLVRVVADLATESFDDELDGYLATHFAWVYPDEDGDSVPATVNLRTGEVLLRQPVPADVRNDVVRTRLEDEDRIETVDAYFDTKDGIWRIRPKDLKELRNW